MKNTENFYLWFISFGGNAANFDVSAVHNKVNARSLYCSTLKSRASEIKEKYNYRFNFPNREFLQSGELSENKLICNTLT